MKLTWNSSRACSLVFRSFWFCPNSSNLLTLWYISSAFLPCSTQTVNHHLSFIMNAPASQYGQTTKTNMRWEQIELAFCRLAVFQREKTLSTFLELDFGPFCSRTTRVLKLLKSKALWRYVRVQQLSTRSTDYRLQQGVQITAVPWKI